MGKNPPDSFLTGARIFLRPLDKKDITGTYVSWLNDPEVTRYLETGVFPTTIGDLKEFYKRMSKSRKDLIFAIVTKKGGTHVGNIKLGEINWVHRYGELGIMIGKRSCWNKGYGREACALLLGHAFKRLNLNKVILGVFGSHRAAIRLYESIGFRAEGRVRKLFFNDGRYEDKVIMGISRDEFMRRGK